MSASYVFSWRPESIKHLFLRCEQISPLPNWIWEIKVDFLLESVLLGMQSVCLINMRSIVSAILSVKVYIYINVK